MRDNISKFLSLFLAGILLLGSMPAHGEGEVTKFNIRFEPIGRGRDMVAGHEYKRGEEISTSVSVKDLKKGEAIEFNLTEGDYTSFNHCTASYGKLNNLVQPEGALDKYLLNTDSLENKFTVPNDISDNILIRYYVVPKLPIKTITNQTANDKLTTTASINNVTVGEDEIPRAKNGEKVKLAAVSSDDNWEFSHWEIKKEGLIWKGIIDGNEALKLNDSEIEFIMITPEELDYNLGNPIAKYDLNIVAHFEDVSGATIESIDDLPIAIYQGMNFILPTVVKANMNIGAPQDKVVTWTPSEVDINKIGIFEFEGTVDGYDLKVKLKLDIKEPYILSFPAGALARTVKQGTSVILPAKITANMSNGKTQQINVDWDTSPDTSRPGVFKIKGTLEGYDREVEYILTVEEVTSYKVNIETRVGGDNTPEAWIIMDENGEDKLVMGGDYRGGTQLNVRAVDGNYTRFRRWYFSIQGIYDINIENYFLDLNSRESIFTVPEIGEFPSDKTIEIQPFFDIQFPVIAAVNPSNIEGFNATTSLGKAISGEEVELNAFSNNEEWEFSHWEFSRPIVGPHTPNEDVNLNSSSIKFKQVCRRDLSGGYTPATDELIITAHFKEKTEENITSIEDIEEEIVIGTEYRLPKTVTAKMSDNTYKELAVTWAPNIVDMDKLGGQVFEGTVEGFDEKVILTLTIKEKETIEEILEIKTVELLKNGQLIASGQISGEDITINLPKDMSQDEIDIIGIGGYFLKITATEGVTIEQEEGYEGPKWQLGEAINTIYIDTPTKFIVHGKNQTKEYILTIKAKVQETEKHTVTFNTNGGNNISSQTVKDGNKVIKPSNPTKDGYKFLNWYTDSSLINIFNFNTSITEDITLYAEWEEVSIPVVGQYIVDFNTNGGNSISLQKIEEGNKATKPSNPTRSGYSFINWYTDPNLTNIFNFNTPITKDITLYAKWDRAVEESSSAKITKFSLLGYEGSIDDRNGYITVYIPYNMELSKLVPNITLSDGATISPSKDIAANFNRNVYYTVYGQDGSKKEYRVSITMPREDNTLENYWDDYYDNYVKKRDDYYKKRSEISWWEMSQEAKVEREKDALKDKKDELLIYKEKTKIMNEIGKIESSFKNSRSSLSISEEYNKIEIKPTVSNFAEGHSNIITIPKGILSSLPKGEYNYLTYATGVVNIDIYPFMETVTGLRLNLKDVPNDIRQKWNKVKGKGFIFEVESDSTKGGLSYELNLEKKYSIEKLRFVKYDYTNGSFIDVSPEKWYVFDGKIRCENVSAGIYGIIYKD